MPSSEVQWKGADNNGTDIVAPAGRGVEILLLDLQRADETGHQLQIT